MNTSAVNFVRRFVSAILSMTILMLAIGFGEGIFMGTTRADDPAKESSKNLDLGKGLTLEVVFIPPGEFMLGSTPEERAWATGIEGGATPGTDRESFEGEARPARIKHGFWMGRNGFGLADMCGGVWEVVLDHFDPRGTREEPYFVDRNPRPVCRGGNYFDVPGNARCAVRLGLQGPAYSDSRDGFRICLGRRVAVK